MIDIISLCKNMTVHSIWGITELPYAQIKGILKYTFGKWLRFIGLSMALNGKMRLKYHKKVLVLFNVV